MRVNLIPNNTGGFNIVIDPPDTVLPSLEMVVTHLPVKMSKLLYHRGRLDYSDTANAVRNGTPISAEKWVNAIGAAILQRDADAANGASFEAAPREADLEGLVERMEKGPTYLVCGSKLLKIATVESLDTTRILNVIKKKHIEKVKVDIAAMHRDAEAEAARVVERGNANADAVINEARQQAWSYTENSRHMKREAEMLLNAARQANTSFIPPDMQQAGYFVRKPSNPGDARYPVELGFYASLQIKEITGQFHDSDGERKIVTWAITPDLGSVDGVGMPIKLLLWLPWNAGTGEYSWRNMHIEATYRFRLPHIDTSWCCAQNPQGLPPLIKTVQDVANMVDVIESIFSNVNLNSLIDGHTGIKYYPPQFTLPKEAQQFSSTGDMGDFVPPEDGFVNGVVRQYDEVARMTRTTLRRLHIG